MAPWMSTGPQPTASASPTSTTSGTRYPNPTRSVALLADLAAGGRALELGIGTGRVAVPLAATGVEVHGIDTSPAIVAKLRAKPGGDAIPSDDR